MRDEKIFRGFAAGLAFTITSLVIFMFVPIQSWAGRPASTDFGPPSAAEAARFLQQATWGPTTALVSHVQNIGFEQFVEEQFAAPMSSYPSLPLVPTTAPDDCPSGSPCRRDNYTLYPVQTRFFTNALYGEDQLRQRVAFALHQILVVSGVDIGQGYPSRL